MPGTGVELSGLRPTKTPISTNDGAKCGALDAGIYPELAELDQRRDDVAAETFGVLTQNLTKAVESLVGLLDHQDDRLRRLMAKDVIDFIIRHKKNENLDKRLTVIEKKLDKRP